MLPAFQRSTIKFFGGRTSAGPSVMRRWLQRARLDYHKIQNSNRWLQPNVDLTNRHIHVRYELSDFEWVAIKPFLPNKPRGASPFATLSKALFAPHGDRRGRDTGAPEGVATRPYRSTDRSPFGPQDLGGSFDYFVGTCQKRFGMPAPPLWQPSYRRRLDVLDESSQPRQAANPISIPIPTATAVVKSGRCLAWSPSRSKASLPARAPAWTASVPKLVASSSATRWPRRKRSVRIGPIASTIWLAAVDAPEAARRPAILPMAPSSFSIARR
jgi:hypothetical protein